MTALRRRCDARRRDGLGVRALALRCVLVGLVSGVACEPKGHASIVRCVGGKIRTLCNERSADHVLFEKRESRAEN